jgi:DNA-binding MarR family transcriptional regulator
MTSPRISDAAAKALVGLLADQDAIFVPPRDPDREGWITTWQLRWNYDSEGMPWRASGRDAKAKERLLSSLVGPGYVTRCTRSVKTTRVKLTPRGDAIARALAARPNVPEAIEMLAQIRELCRKRRKTWLAEIALNEGRGWGDGHHEELQRVEDDLLPSLVRRWVDCNATTRRAVFYSLTDTGRNVLAGENDQHIPDELPEPWPGCEDLYILEVKAALDRLRDAEPPDLREIGRIPFPASGPIADEGC